MMLLVRRLKRICGNKHAAVLECPVAAIILLREPVHKLPGASLQRNGENMTSRDLGDADYIAFNLL
jgi:hypothetical protein